MKRNAYIAVVIVALASIVAIIKIHTTENKVHTDYEKYFDGGKNE